MITAFQIGAFQFTGFQEGVAAGSGGWRPRISGWGLRHALELAEQRRRKALADLEERARLEEEEARQARERGGESLAQPVLRAAPSQTILNLRAVPGLDVDAELEEFGALMKMVAELDEVC